jgi:threonine aldolase
MAKAEVGDDVFGENPTVDRLEKMAAERLGKQASQSGLHAGSQGTCR